MKKFLLLLVGLAGAFSPPSFAQTDSVYNANVEEVIVICKTHFDLGFTHSVKDIVNIYRTSMIDDACKVMAEFDALPEDMTFSWTTPGWVMSKVMDDWQGQSPARKARLNKAFTEGKLIIHALPYTTQTDICGVEEITRGLDFSAQLSRRFGKPLPVSAKVTDVPSHSGAMPTILANAGVKFLHIGCNWPSGFVKLPPVFWWEGPDGSRLLTMYSPTYGTSTGIYPKEWSHPDDPMQGENLIPAKDWPYKTWPAILVSADNTGAPTAEKMKMMFDEIHRKMPHVKVRMGTMDDFYYAFMKENPQLAIVKNEMPDTWIHGIMCDPGGVKTYRNTHQMLPAAESLNTLLLSLGVPVDDASKQVADAYEKVGLFGEHTWGGSKQIEVYGDKFQQLDPQSYAKLEQTWEDKTDYVRNASAVTDSLLSSNLNVLATNVTHTSPSVLVYNALPWERSGIVEVDNQKVQVDHIPAGGYKVVPRPTLSFKTKKVEGNMLENDYFKVTFDAKQGSIVSLIDKRTGREWIDQCSSYQLGQYMNERFSYDQTVQFTLDIEQGRSKGWLHPGMHKLGMSTEKEVPYRAAFSGKGRLSLTEEEFCLRAEMEMPADRANKLPASKFCVTLHKSQPYIDLEITLVDKAKDNWPEADWLCLPFKVDHPTFEVYRNLGVMNPKEIRCGANRHLYAVGNGVSMTDNDGNGVAICPLDHPLISLDTPGCWKYSYDFEPQKPIVFLNLYNNQWNTNFRYWYSGSWSSRVRIGFFDRNTPQEEKLTVPALEARTPLQSIETKGKGGALPDVYTGISVSRKGVEVTAFNRKTNEEGEVLLRLWDKTGLTGNVTVEFPLSFNFKHATPVNLRGEKTGQSISVVQGKLTFVLKEYAPASFILSE